MNSPPAHPQHMFDVDAIVREVVRRLRNQGDANKPAAPVSTSVASASPPPTAAVRLDRRLITLADLPENLAPAQRLEVPRSTVVTPAARDALKQMGVALSRVAEQRAQAESPDRYLLLDGEPQNRGWTSAVAATEARGFRRRQALLPECIAQVRLVLEANPVSQVLFLTARPYLAAAAISRIAAARAAVLPRAEWLPAILDDLAPNVLVLDVATWPPFQLPLLAGRWRITSPDPSITSLLKERSAHAHRQGSRHRDAQSLPPKLRGRDFEDGSIPITREPVGGDAVVRG